MQKSTYISMTDALRARPALARGVSLANKIITDAVYVAYPCLLVWLAYAAATGAAGAAGALFAGGTSPGHLVRAGYRVAQGHQRAASVRGVRRIAPVIPKDTRGNSFPSRHAFSIFVIAMTFYACCPLAWAGPVMFAAGVLLAVIRVVSGVHFPCDVVVGALLGMLAGFVGLWIL